MAVFASYLLFYLAPSACNQEATKRSLCNKSENGALRSKSSASSLPQMGNTESTAACSVSRRREYRQLKDGSRAATILFCIAFRRVSKWWWPEEFQSRFCPGFALLNQICFSQKLDRAQRDSLNISALRDEIKRKTEVTNKFDTLSLRMSNLVMTFHRNLTTRHVAKRYSYTT